MRDLENKLTQSSLDGSEKSRLSDHHYKIYQSLNADRPAKKRFQDALTLCTQALDSLDEDHFMEALNPVLEGHAEKLRKEILGIDHIGFIAPLSLEDVYVLSNQEGFDNGIKILDSQVLALSLGQLVNKEIVPTKIFKAKNSQRKGIEIFIPVENPEVIDGWISNAVGYHLAFKVKNKESIETIGSILADKNIYLMEFLKGKPAVNDKENSIISYYEIDLPSEKVCFEFCHY